MAASLSMAINQAGTVNFIDIELGGWDLGWGYQLNPPGDCNILCRSSKPQVTTYHVAVFRGTTQGRGYGGGGGEWDRVTNFSLSYVCLFVCLVGWLFDIGYGGGS